MGSVGCVGIFDYESLFDRLIIYFNPSCLRLVEMPVNNVIIDMINAQN